MISIITVVYNDPVGLEKTISSVINQKLSDHSIEFVVVDGGSGPDTIQVLNRYAHFINSWISEKDNGIYDAMNKGIDLSKGEWIYFLNAGDLLDSADVLNKIVDVINRSEGKHNFIYGKYKVDNNVCQQHLSLEFLVSHMINHQSIIYHRELFKRYKYNSIYRFCADYDHLLNTWSALKPKQVDFCISEFDSTGVSSQSRNKSRMWSERLSAVWHSDFKLLYKLRLSSRGLLALPWHYIKNTFFK